jgi:hypothetical protein
MVPLLLLLSFDENIAWIASEASEADASLEMEAKVDEKGGAETDLPRPVVGWKGGAAAAPVS